MVYKHAISTIVPARNVTSGYEYTGGFNANGTGNGNKTGGGSSGKPPIGQE